MTMGSSVLVSGSFLSRFAKPGIMSSPSSNNEGNDAWLMKIDLKREEQEETHKERKIKREAEDPAPASGEADTL